MKTFVLDTNVLLYDPSAIFKFGNNTVFIPLVVVEELDRFKRDQNENGRNARQFARSVDELRAKGNLGTGVILDNGGTLQIGALNDDIEVPSIGLDLKSNDNLILLSALILKKKVENVILISKDINLRLKADALEMESEDYESSHVDNLDELYSGHKVFTTSEKNLSTFETERFLPMATDEQAEFFANQYITLEVLENPQRRLYGRFSKKKGGIVPLIRYREGVWGIHPRNLEQQFAFDALLNNEVNLVSLVGKAGTGKTLMAIAAGLEATISQRFYSRVLVSRPIIPMGNDLGFLPGDVNEKLGPWMQPIFDNIDFLFGSQRARNEMTTWDELINQGLLHVEPLTYIRGRSLPGQYMIVDEAQNLTPHEVKTIITRAGEGTKIVLTGDCEQIDSPYLDSISNGLAYCIERCKGEDIVGHTTLKVGERSPLSEMASQLL